jgi:hypothetical protein
MSKEDIYYELLIEVTHSRLEMKYDQLLSELKDTRLEMKPSRTITDQLCLDQLREILNVEYIYGYSPIILTDLSEKFYFIDEVIENENELTDVGYSLDKMYMDNIKVFGRCRFSKIVLKNPELAFDILQWKKMKINQYLFINTIAYPELSTHVKYKVFHKDIAY